MTGSFLHNSSDMSLLDSSCSTTNYEQAAQFHCMALIGQINDGIIFELNTQSTDIDVVGKLDERKIWEKRFELGLRMNEISAITLLLANLDSLS